jgi:hypothetical protein
MSESSSLEEPEGVVSDQEEPEKESVRDRRDEGRATVSMVLGIAGIILAWLPIVSIVLGAVAIGFGVTRVKSRSRRIAMLGIAFGVVAIGLNVAATVFIFS